MDPAHALMELQERDLAVARLGKQLDEMPEKRAILAARAKIAEIRTLHARAQAAVHAIDAAVKRFEDESAGISVKIDAEQAKLLSGEVKNPKELQAISHELDALKKHLDKMDADTLAKMQERENAEGQVARIAAAVQAGEAKEAELTERFKHRGGDILREIESENVARSALIAALPDDLRVRYEATREAKHGIAVGALRGGMCTACRVGLPAGTIEKLEQGPDLGTCPSCGRILVVRGASGD